MFPSLLILVQFLLLPGGQCSGEVEDIQGVTVIKESFPTTQENVEFGTGYNSLKLQRTYNNPVNAESARRDLKSNGYISVNYKIKVCKDRNEFVRAFSGGLSASGSYMGVGGTASVGFLTETTITSLDTVLIANVDAITDTESVTKATFTDAAKKLLDDGNYGEFVETYGTHYLRKIILGGKMMLVLKFTSESKEIKNEIDTKLGASAGVFEGEATFSAKMKDVQGSSKLQVSLYASGGNTAPPASDVDACMKFTSDFAKSVQTYSAVREVEFAGLWTLPGMPSDFKKFLFPLQGDTDQLVHTSVNLLNVQSRVEDMIAQKNSDLSFITGGSWKTITSLGNKAKKDRKNVQRAFKTEPATDYKKILKEYKDTASELSAQLDELLEKERLYRSTESIYLRSAGSGAFVSTADGDYIRADPKSPIPLKIEDTSGAQGAVPIGGSSYVYIRSTVNSNNYLCFSRGKFYGVWKTDSSSEKCMWRIAKADATKVDHKTLSYGDEVIFYNRMYPDWIMGVSKDGEWIASKKDSEIHNEKHHWYVEKSN